VSYALYKISLLNSVCTVGRESKDFWNNFKSRVLWWFGDNLLTTFCWRQWSIKSLPLKSFLVLLYIINKLVSSTFYDFLVYLCLVAIYTKFNATCCKSVNRKQLDVVLWFFSCKNNRILFVWKESLKLFLLHMIKILGKVCNWNYKCIFRKSHTSSPKLISNSGINITCYCYSDE